MIGAGASSGLVRVPAAHRVVTTFILTFPSTTTNNTTTTTRSSSKQQQQQQQQKEQQPPTTTRASTSIPPPPPPPPQVALFHRCDSMLTFPSHWAGISGTIEEGETPYEAAQRELHEETNITEKVNERGGLYLDVPYVSPRTQEERTIRVYPFVVHVPAEQASHLELRGTEHDRYQLVTIDQFQQLESESVPGLVQAFRHATYGAYDKKISPEIRTWAQDVENGASVLTANALKILEDDSNKAKENDVDNTAEDEDDACWQTKAEQMTMLRPSMVPICNVMRELLKRRSRHAVTVENFQKSQQASVELGIRAIEMLLEAKASLSSSSSPNSEDGKNKFTIATFSRSGTLRQILTPFLELIEIVCGQSSPGNEGELMARDLEGSTSISDSELKTLLASAGTSERRVDLLLIGADCVLPEANEIVNKVGTRDLCQIARQHHVPVYCCTDRWKVWEDKFPPPLEEDLFETVSLDFVTKMLLPPAS